MKKLFSIIIACVMLLIVMTACSSHSHTETGNWIADATGHWKQCKDCDEKIQSGNHTLNDESRCTVCNSEVMESDESASVFTFDEHNNILRMAEYDKDGKLLSETVNEYEYDADGNLKKSKEYVDGRLSGETEYTVADGESIPTKMTQYSEDGTKSYNEYDAHGNVTLFIAYEADGTESMKSTSQHAQSGDGEWYESASTETYNDGTKIEAKYNEHGSNTSRVIYDADGKVTSNETWEYTYDDDGNPVTEKAYLDGKLSKETVYKTVTEDDSSFTFPETVTTYDVDGGKTVCVYDENDELISETKYNASGNVIE